MTTLNSKQKAKVKAALCLIHDHGKDAQAVVNAASAMMAIGHPIHTAYEKALNDFNASNPAIAHVMSRITLLIEASSPSTVDQYNQALSTYIDFGDDSGMLALSPMIARDSVALAIHNGEMSEADVATGGLAMAMGFEPGAALKESFSWAPTAPTAAQATARPEDAFSSQVSPVEGTGIVSPNAQARVDRDKGHYTGWTPDAPALPGLTPAAAYEAARASTSRGSYFIPDAEGPS